MGNLKILGVFIPLLLILGCSGGGGGSAPETIEDITNNEIEELWKSIPEEYSFSSEELALIESEILSQNLNDLESEEIAKLIESEKENVDAKEGGN